VTDVNSINMANLTTSITSPLNAALQNINQLYNSIQTAHKTISDQRIPVSLKRFDNWFQLFLRSQNLRWLIIEFLFPIVLGLSAQYLLSSNL